MHLNQTTKEVIKKIQQAEQDKTFHIHIDPAPKVSFIPIDEQYSYDRPWFKEVGYFFLRQLIVKPYRFYANHIWFKTKVKGSSNLNSISGGAIVTCNHINKLDSLVVGHAIKKKKIWYTAMEENNFESPLGSFMRAYGMLSIPKEHSSLRKFYERVEKILEKKEWILFFPEGSEWWCYEKPRPYQIGAFHFAAKHRVPILPLFITFKKTNQFDNQSIEKREFILHILRPIYPRQGYSLNENKQYLKQENERSVWECYHRFYSIDQVTK